MYIGTGGKQSRRRDSSLPSTPDAVWSTSAIPVATVLKQGAGVLWKRNGQTNSWVQTVVANVWKIYTSTADGSGAAATQRLQLDATGNLTAAGDVANNSDERIKKNWRPVGENFVARLASVLSGVYDRIDIEKTQAGVGAQSLRELLPEVIGEDDNGILTVAYGNAALVAAVELAKEVVELRKDVAELKERLAKFESQE